MAKIVLEDTNGGYNIASINRNFQKIMTEMNNKISYRLNDIPGESNAWLSDMDANGKRLYNLPEPVLSSEAARLQDVQNGISGLVPANLIPFTPFGSISSNTVQGAIQEVSGDVDALTGVVTTGLATLGGQITAVGVRTTKLEDIVAKSGGHPSTPAFIEQHITGFFGRGMLTSEPINTITDQAIAANASLGATSIAVSNSASFVVGGCCTIKHDNGLYDTYFVGSIGVGTIGIYPALRYPCTLGTARIERLWFNRAHPGKFYMRYLAQRIARDTELRNAMPSGKRILFTNVADSSLENALVAVGGANISYFSPDNLGETGTVASPVRFTLARGAYVDNFSTNSQGAETQFFSVEDVADATIKVVFSAKATATVFSITAVDDLGVERGKYVIPKDENSRALQIYTFPANLRGAKKVKVRVLTEFFVNAGYYVLEQIDVFEGNGLSGKMITKETASIVCLGDSWTQGDVGSTPEREPITTQLALELPNATIRNAGIGGNKITDMLARFDTDVTPYAPEYVVVQSGTNEAYSPLAGTFDPTAIQDFLNAFSKVINKILAIGARPIIIGPPALAQSDADVPAFAEWLLNDRARAYSRYFFEWQGNKPFIDYGTNANGSWTKFKNGTLICRGSVSVTTTAANTLASSVWTFPMAFTAAPTVSSAITGYATNQILAGGLGAPSTTTTPVTMVSATSGTTQTIITTAIGRWF